MADLRYRYGRTFALVTLILSELLRAYSARSEKLPLWKLGVFSNRNMNLATIVSFGLLLIIMFIPALADIFNVEMFRLQDWGFTAIMAVLPLVFGELTKVVRNTLSKSSQN